MKPKLSKSAVQLREQIDDAFIAPKPEGAYILDESTCRWVLDESKEL